jgi:hypothetical protein
MGESLEVDAVRSYGSSSAPDSSTPAAFTRDLAHSSNEKMMLIPRSNILRLSFPSFFELLFLVDYLHKGIDHKDMCQLYGDMACFSIETNILLKHLNSKRFSLCKIRLSVIDYVGGNGMKESGKINARNRSFIS